MTNAFTTNDGFTLRSISVPCEGARGSIVIVHGVGEHMHRYDHTIRFFQKNGFSCWSYDQRGFGSSPGRRGHVRRFSDYVDDLECLVAITRDTKPNPPLFVLSHSMGSLISLLYAIRRPSELAGLVSLSTPLVMPAGRMRWALPLVAKLAGPLPKLSIPNSLDARWLSHDVEVVRDYKDDDRNVRFVTASWLRALVAARSQILEEARSIEVPVFVGHGTSDQIADPDSARQLFKCLRPEQTTLKFYDGLRHELLNESEPGRSQVRQDILAWLGETVSTHR